MTYDENVRRNTPLALELKARIARDGPISVEDYITACLFDAKFGYYRTATAIGEQGDFITGPEISQVFGELIGLWCVAVWQQIGAPQTFNLIELGPGRGTLMADMLRAARLRPDFLKAAQVRLIECSQHLQGLQRTRLQDWGEKTSWHDGLFDISGNDDIGFETRLSFAPQPTVIVANEFLDTRPVRQFIRSTSGWHERTVAANSQDELQFSRRDGEARGIGGLVSQHPAANVGDIIEQGGAIGDLTVPLDMMGRHFPVVGVFIDYGHTSSAPGETLQAVRNHQFEHPLTSPGEADLTAHVDFEQVGRQMMEAGFAIDGPATQAQFFGALGITERASALMAANPGKAAQIEAGVARLMAPTGMGTRFKVIGVRSRNLAPLPGLAPLDTQRHGA